MIPNEENRWHYLPVKKLLALLRQITSKSNGDFIARIAASPLEQKTNLNHIRKHIKIKIFVMPLWPLKTIKC